MGTNKSARPMRALSEKLVTNYEVQVTEKEEENLPLTEIQECPKNLWRRLTTRTEAVSTLDVEKPSHTETSQKRKELIVSEEDGVFRKKIIRTLPSP